MQECLYRSVLIITPKCNNPEILVSVKSRGLILSHHGARLQEIDENFSCA
jgi:hypothetical protein